MIEFLKHYKMMDKEALISEIDRLAEFYYMYKSAGGEAFVLSIKKAIEKMETKTKTDN